MAADNISFFFFQSKLGLTFYVNHQHSRQFTWSIKLYFHWFFIFLSEKIWHETLCELPAIHLYFCKKKKKKKKKNSMLSASNWKCILRVKGAHIKSVCEHQKPRPWCTCTICIHNTWSLWNLLYFRQIALKFCDQMAYANSAYHNPSQQAQIGVNTVCHSTKYFVKQIYKNIGKKKSMEVIEIVGSGDTSIV